jgi:hypothetical protein
MKTSNKILLTAFGVIIVVMIVSIIGFRSMIYSSFIEGDGNILEQQREIASFDRVSVRGKLQVYYSQTENPSLQLSADSNLHEFISTEVSGNELIIKMNKPLRSRNEMRIEVSSNNLRNVEASAGAGFTTQNNLQAHELRLTGNAGAKMDVAGNFEAIYTTQNAGSSIRLAGTTRYLEISSNAGGSVNAMDMEAEFAKADANAGGSARINAKEIEASANAGGSIYYSGNPHFRNMSTSAGGNIRKQN